ncbi:hypothetical protein ACF0H5_015618 [Mactra antiquata]
MVMKKQYVVLFAGVLLLFVIFSMSGVHDRMPTTTLQPSDISSGIMNIARYLKPDFVFRGTGNEVQVLLLTYMRSGSSLTGDILQHSPGAFYIYEPFRSLGHKNSSTFTIEFANGTSRAPPYNFAEVAYDNLYNWFTCNMTNIPNIGLNDGFLKKGLKSRLYPICMNDIKGDMDPKNGINICARQLQAVCKNSPFRIIKTIRLLMRDIKNLLEDLPNLKIIHLVRDPRATLFSQSKLGKCGEKKGGRPGCTNRFCTRVELDVLEEEKLSKKYPGRIMPVFYQDIAKEPLKTSQKLYDFIGAEFTQAAQEYVYNITMAGNPNNCAICTTRSNSSEHIDTWKERMDPLFREIVNERCNYIIQRYNFDK